MDPIGIEYFKNPPKFLKAYFDQEKFTSLKYPFNFNTKIITKAFMASVIDLLIPNPSIFKLKYLMNKYTHTIWKQ